MATNFSEQNEEFMWVCKFDSFSGTIEHSFDWTPEYPPVICIQASGGKEELTAELVFQEQPEEIDLQLNHLMTFPRPFPNGTMTFRIMGNATEPCRVVIYWGYGADELYALEYGEYYTYE